MFFIITIIAIVAQGVIALLVLLNNRKRLANLLFFLLSIFVTTWASINFIITNDPHSTNQLTLYRLLMLSVVIQNTFFFFFARTYPNANLGLGRSVLAKYLLLSFLAGFATLSPLVFSGVDYDPVAGARPVTGPGMLIFILHAAISVGFGMKIMISRFKNSRGIQHRQLGMILSGSIVLWGLVPLTNFIISLATKTLFFAQISPLYTLAFSSLIAYAIVRHKLFDIKLAAVRTMAYGLSILTLSSIYYFVAYIVSVLIFGGEVSSTVSISPVNIGLALILAFVFQPIKHFFDKITDRIFYREQYKVDDFYAQLSETLTTTTDLRSLLERASREIGDTLKAEQAFFYTQWNHTHHLSAGTKGHKLLPLADAHYLNKYVDKNGDTIIITELLDQNDNQIRRLLLSHKIAVLMPLVRRGTPIGYLALGDHQSGGYTNRDIKVLNTISDELIIAIQNALNVQEVKDINIHLEQRIDAATKELKTKNTQLRHLDATKDEFLSMASHQLRTPLTSVKGYLSMVLEGDAGKISDTQRHLLGEAFVGSERMVHLIHDFLNVSRLQTGKFMLESRPTDLIQLVESEIRSLNRVAEAHDLKLKFSHEGDIPLLNIDETKIQQVVMNYIDNALYYSRQTELPIRIDLARVGDNVELRVIDNGIGVPKVEQAQLFSKFYRASNARKQRPDGTGVGIFLAKKVIDAHGGEVLFESEEGKGSTFGFSLPVTKLEVSSEKQPKELVEDHA